MLEVQQLKATSSHAAKERGMRRRMDGENEEGSSCMEGPREEEAEEEVLGETIRQKQALLPSGD